MAKPKQSTVNLRADWDKRAAGEDALQAIKDFLEWGAKTGSDRELFDDRFRGALRKAGIKFAEPEY